MDQAISCGLLLSEVFTNTFKHAFIDKKEGVILLNLSESEGQVYISVTDNGCGFDTTLSCKKSELSLVSLLSRQLEGNSEFTSCSAGTSFNLSFTKIRISS